MKGTRKQSQPPKRGLLRYTLSLQGLLRRINQLIAEGGWRDPDVVAKKFPIGPFDIWAVDRLELERRPKLLAVEMLLTTWLRITIEANWGKWHSIRSLRGQNLGRLEQQHKGCDSRAVLHTLGWARAS